MSVVQHTFALFFYLYEKMRYYDDYVKSGEYSKSTIFTNFSNVFGELAGKTWGIVGLGHIGSRVADAARAFGCRLYITQQAVIHMIQNMRRLTLIIY